MADDDLTRAARRARSVLPAPIARLVEDELRRGIAGASYQWHEPYAPLAVAVLALPEPGRGYGELVCRRCDVQAAFCPCELPDVPAPDRDAEPLECQIFDIISDHVRCVPMEGHSYLYEIEVSSIEKPADALISAGLVRGPVTAEQWPMDTDWDRAIECGRCAEELLPGPGDRERLFTVADLLAVIGEHTPQCAGGRVARPAAGTTDRRTT